MEKADDLLKDMALELLMNANNLLETKLRKKEGIIKEIFELSKRRSVSRDDIEKIINDVNSND